MPDLAYNQYAYEDIEPGERFEIGRHTLETKEMIEVANRWDPMPFHIDEELAAQSHFGGLTASGIHLLAIRIQMVQAGGINPHIVASLGHEEVRFLQPARPGETLTLFGECVEKRESKSRPGTGIVKLRFELENDAGETVLSMLDTKMVFKRGVRR